MQVGLFDSVGIQNREVPYPGCAQILQDCASEPSSANDRDGGSSKPTLPNFPYLGKHTLSGVAQIQHRAAASSHSRSLNSGLGCFRISVTTAAQSAPAA